jgi:hypothetical protein
MTGRRRAPPADQHANAHAHPDAHAGMHSAHARIRMHTHACSAAYTHTHTHMYPVVHVSRARSRPARPRVGASAGAGVSAAAGHSQTLEVGPVGRRRQRRELGVARGPARQPCGSGPPRRSAARASHACAGLGRRPTTGSAAAAASNAARCGSAPRPGSANARQRMRRPRRKRARRWRRRARDAQGLQELAPAEPLGERLHLRGADAPAVHRVRVRPAPAAQPMGGRGDERAEAMERRPRMPYTRTRMRVIGTPVRSERRLYAKADVNPHGRIRTRTRRNRTRA